MKTKAYGLCARNLCRGIAARQESTAKQGTSAVGLRTRKRSQKLEAKEAMSQSKVCLSYKIWKERTWEGWSTQSRESSACGERSSCRDSWASTAAELGITRKLDSEKEKG